MATYDDLRNEFGVAMRTALDTDADRWPRVQPHIANVYSLITQLERQYKSMASDLAAMVAAIPAYEEEPRIRQEYGAQEAV